MKRSLLALVLALIMCLSLFCTSCGSGDKEDENLISTEQAEIPPLTLTLYAPTKGTTTQDEIEVVQKAFNNITQSKFNTNVILKLIPEDDYDGVIKDKLAAIQKQKEEEEAAEESRFQAEQEALLKGETLPPEEEPETEESSSSSSDSPEISYPAEKENQLDIFLIHSFETYYELAKSEQLADITESLSTNAKLLGSYVYPYLFRSSKIEGATYGVFNNTVFGEYQYLLLNKALVDKYEYDPENMKDLSSISLFLTEVKNGEQDTIPFLGEIEAPVVYWDNEESLIGSYCGSALTSSGSVDATSYIPEAVYPTNLLAQSAYVNWLKEYNKLYQAGCIVDETAENKNSKFAAKIITGDVTLSPTYANTYGKYKTDEYGFKYITDENGVDYYVSVYRRPIADNDNIFGSGYVISSSVDPNNIDRCMEIITALNTDANLSNIFMYGVQDVHYTISEETGMVHKITDKYAMDITTAGNMYLLKQSDDMSDYWKAMSNNGWENAKNTNREAVLSPLTGFYFNPPVPEPEEEEPAETPDGEEGENTEEPAAPKVTTDKTFKEVMEEIKALTPSYLDPLMTFKDTEELNFNRFVKSKQTASMEEELIKYLTDHEYDIYYIRETYNKWFEEHYGVKLGL